MNPYYALHCLCPCRLCNVVQNPSWMAFSTAAVGRWYVWEKGVFWQSQLATWAEQSKCTNIYAWLVPRCIGWKNISSHYLNGKAFKPHGVWCCVFRGLPFQRLLLVSFPGEYPHSAQKSSSAWCFPHYATQRKLIHIPFQKKALCEFLQKLAEFSQNCDSVALVWHKFARQTLHEGKTTSPMGVSFRERAVD